MVATCLRVGGRTRQSNTLPSCSSTCSPLATSSRRSQSSASTSRMCRTPTSRGVARTWARSASGSCHGE